MTDHEHTPPTYVPNARVTRVLSEEVAQLDADSSPQRTLPNRGARMTLAQQQEALSLLRLIDSEFRSDPKSTQCFDLRIVQRVAALVETLSWEAPNG